MNRIWIAEIWTNGESWEILDNVFHEHIDDAKEAIMEEMEVEEGWVPVGKWDGDRETGGERIAFRSGDEYNDIEIETRVRHLTASY